MSDSTAEPLEELEYLRLGDLAIQGFRRLSEKYSEAIDQDRHAVLSELETLSIDETTTSKEERLNDLQFHLLPALHLQFADISNSLRPSCLQAGDKLKLKRLLGIHDDIERTIDEVQSHINILCPDIRTIYTTAHRADDQHLKQFKSYRLHNLRILFVSAVPFIYLIFSDAYRLLERLIIHPETYKTSPNFPGDFLIERTFFYIHWMIECIRGSDLDIAQWFWRDHLKSFDNLLIEVKMLVDPHTYYKIENEVKEPTQKVVSEPVIHLADVATTLIRLSHLFFTKLSTRWMNKKRLPYSTEMSSEQIESLAESIRKVTTDITEFTGLLRTADQQMIDNQDELSQGFIKIGTNLKSRFDPPLLVILLYLLPIIPETSLGLPDQNYYKDWFVTWNTQRLLVTENFINLAQSLGNYS
ncbi:hypothetical protein MJO29_014938 [Puccinia striiformis f. sp. tritici]|nr:hypothetical protein MJO29_014938 [Puccinia striiformis f. sp. tritici]